VSTEISQQALRLQHHASVVIWGGNNENEGYVQDQMGPKMGPAPHEVYLADYVKLYIDTGMTALRAVDPDVAFVDSSPSNGVISTEPYTKRWGDVNDVLRGDVHYYNYDADCEDFTTYPRAHFVSEHGFQSFPSFLAYQPFLSKSDWSRNSTELLRRQRHPEGQEQMLKMLERHFRLPPEHADGEPAQRKVFDDFLYLTQVQQSRCYETAIAHWRRLRADPSVKTMGVLYWQLNDIWPGPSWSTIERSGAWRLTHSAVQRSYDPLLPSLLVDKGTIRSFLTSDLASPVRATLRVALHRWGVQQRSQGVHILSCSVLVESAGTGECASADLSTAMASAGCGSADCFVSLEGTALVDGVPKSLSAQAFLTPLKDANLPIASLQVGSPTKLGAKRASVTVTTNATAVYVALESATVIGRFVPNAFMLFPGDQVLVDFVAREAFDIDRWHAGLKIRSLRDTYDETQTRLGGGNGSPSVADSGGHRQDDVALFQ
jgi:beta-mannosidase